MCASKYKNGKNKENSLHEHQHGEGVRQETSQDKGEGAPKKLEKKGEHSKWISFLNDFNMQYANENEISTACTVLTVFLIIKVQKSVKVV